MPSSTPYFQYDQNEFVSITLSPPGKTPSVISHKELRSQLDCTLDVVMWHISAHTEQIGLAYRLVREWIAADIAPDPLPEEATDRDEMLAQLHSWFGTRLNGPDVVRFLCDATFGDDYSLVPKPNSDVDDGLLPALSAYLNWTWYKGTFEDWKYLKVYLCNHSKDAIRSEIPKDDTNYSKVDTIVASVAHHATTVVDLYRDKLEYDLLLDQLCGDEPDTVIQEWLCCFALTRYCLQADNRVQFQTKLDGLSDEKVTALMIRLGDVLTEQVLLGHRTLSEADRGALDEVVRIFLPTRGN